MSTAKDQTPAIAPARLPYHPAIQERFGVDQTTWRALVESTFPNAQTTEAVILALAYCRARNLDPLKRTVHIVPIWDKQRRRYVETVWPGIAEYRTTAFRTGLYAGRDDAKFGPTIEQAWTDEGQEVKVAFPEWAQVTVYRLCGGQRVAFVGPRVYWLETYARIKSGAPNEMWRKRPIGQLEKCAEAAALRTAFPEELGDEETADEAGGFMWHGRATVAGETAPAITYPTKSDALAAQFASPEPESQVDPAVEAADGVDAPPPDMTTAEQYAIDLDQAIDAGEAAVRQVISRIEADGSLSPGDRKQLKTLGAKALGGC